MNLDMIMGFFAGLGIYVSARAFIQINKKIGIAQLILTLISPIFVSLWCMKKEDFVFGGTDWEFLVQTATVDKCLQPLLILFLYALFICITSYSIIKIIKIEINKINTNSK